jgi:acyl-CoA synthetase (AMP-forming)/AMP-acid ligase II
MWRVSLGLLLEMAASGYGGRVALGRRNGGTTFSRLSELASGGGAVLASQSFRHVVLLARNGPLVPHVLFASAYAGMPFVPLNYRLSAQPLRELLARLEAPLVIAEQEYMPIVADIAAAMTASQFVAASVAAAPGGAVFVDDSAPAVLLFTSGTTSEPKVVPLRHENLQAYVFGTVEFGSAMEEDAALVSVPPYHIAAIGSILSNLYAGRRVVYLPDFTPQKWLELVREESVTSAMVVPTMLTRIVEHLAGRLAGTTSLRLISYGGARMPVPVLEKALTAFPDAGFVNAYGLTETSSTIALLDPDEHRNALSATDPKQRVRLGSAGRPVPSIEMQIRDDSGAVLGPELVGELWVRGAQVVGDYLGVGSVLDAEGWFPTHDRGWLDADGFLFIEGRSDDTVIRGGENIAPAEVEDALLTYPGVVDAAVVGIEDDEWGQRLVAVIVRRDGSAVEEDVLKQHVRRLLRGSRTPDEIVFRAELPRTATGKLLRREIIRDVNAQFSAGSA